MTTAHKIVEFVWGCILVVVLITMTGALLGAHCAEIAERTALDVASCAEASVARAASPIIGDVAGWILGSSTETQATDALKTIGVTAGASALLCALDRIIADLGGPPKATPGHAAASQSAERVNRAIRLRQAAVSGAPPIGG